MTDTLTISLGLLGMVGGPLLSFFVARATLRAHKPNREAEAGLAEASAQQQNITAQGGVIATLTAETARQEAQFQKLLRRFEALEANLESSDEQNDLLGQQLNAAYEQVRVLKAQNKILTEALNAASSWMRRYFDTGHPAGMSPPPIFLPFTA